MISGDIDEFEIRATSSDKEPRIWTRDTLDTAKSIADQAVSRLGYERAQVVNTYGGVRSDILYLAEPWPRTYYVGVDMTRERLTIVVNRPMKGIPFSVWRGIVQVSYSSISTPTTEVFYFPNEEHVKKAERILSGALFLPVNGKCEDYEACGYCGFDHEYEYESAHKWHTNNPGKGY